MNKKKLKKVGFRVGVVSTLGLTYYITRLRAKRLIKKTNVETKLTPVEKIAFPVDKFIRALGSRSNIKSVTSTLDSVNVVVDDVSKVNSKDLKQFKSDGVKGLLKRANKLTVIFDKNSRGVNDVIRQSINAMESAEIIGGSIRETVRKLTK